MNITRRKQYLVNTAIFMSAPMERLEREFSGKILNDEEVERMPLGEQGNSDIFQKGPEWLGCVPYQRCGLGQVMTLSVTQ